MAYVRYDLPHRRRTDLEYVASKTIVALIIRMIKEMKTGYSYAYIVQMVNLNRSAAIRFRP